MPNLAVVLKDEIRRLARKELRGELATVRKAVTQHRRELADLKRQIRDQDRKIAAAARGPASVPTDPEEGSGTESRFSPKSLFSHRQKLELSAADYAALVGVSPQTVYNWEKGKSRPRAAQLEAWRAIRKLGKREIQSRLAEME